MARKSKLIANAIANLSATKEELSASSSIPSLTGSRHEKIPVDKIDRNPWQPRRKVDIANIEDLAKSIAENSQIEPILVRPKGDRYELVAGERRWLAHQHLLRSHIEAVIQHINDSQMAVFSLVENMQRKDLTDYETGMAITRIVKEFKFKKELADVLSIGKTDFFRYMAFSVLPEWVLIKLNSSPSLLSKRSAEDLKNFLKDKDANQYRNAILNALDKLESGKLQNNQIIEYISRSTEAISKKTINPNILTSSFEQNGRAIGKLKFEPNKKLTLSLDGSVITNDKFRAIEQFIRGLID